MKFDPKQHHRHSIRLKGYDYSNHGAYFVTICSHEKKCIFGNVVDGKMLLNDLGKIVEAEWIKCGELRIDVALHAFVVMPNHFHGIVLICDDDDGRGTARRAPTVEQFGKPVAGSLPTIVRAFKSAVTKRINIHRDTPGVPVWQRNYYEHVIRDDADYTRIAEYVADNPRRWIEDTLHPDNFKDAIVHANNTGRGNNYIRGNGDIVGAYGHTPLRNVPKPGGRHE